jgi:endo-1,3-1,4-beta-glycanase ExoK
MPSCTHSLTARDNFTYRGLTTLVLAAACLWAGDVEAKPYKGAEVYTQTTYQFGRIEVRMRSARGGGVLSTFFTYKPGSEGAGVAWEEIDVEVMGKSNAAAFQSNILVGNPRMGSEQIHQAATSLADGYHTYTIEWTPTSVVWLLDGVETRRTTGGQANQLTNPHNFRFNLWASDVSSWAGAFESSTLPQYQFVNWIRYYRYEGGTFVLDWSDDFNTFDTARWSKADWTFDGNLVDFAPNNAVARDGALVLCLAAEGQACTAAVPPDGSGNGGTSGAGGATGMAGSGGSGGSAGAGGTPTGGLGGAAAGSGGAFSGGAGTTGGAGTGGSTPAAGAPSASAGVAGALAMAGATSGTPGVAGAPSSVGGTAPSTGGSPVGNGAVTGTGPDEGGCGCAVAGQTSQGWLGLALAFGLGLATSLRRRR